MRKALMAAFAAYIGMGASAYAADLGGSMKDTPVYSVPKSWTGFYLGAGIGAGASVTDVDVNVQDCCGGEAKGESYNILNFDGIGGEGLFGTVQLGYDYQLSQSFVIGAFVDYDFSNISTDLDVFGFSANLDLDHMWSVGARFGWLATPDTLWYALAAYSQAKYDLSDNAGLAQFTDVGSFDGWTAGLGVETRLTDNWSLKAEYRFTQFDGETIFGGGDDDCLNVDFEPSVHTGRVVLSYRINPFEPAIEPYK